jgi:mannitol/fructose-specific phosphotransferase system IIA component (Ntr-type)
VNLASLLAERQIVTDLSSESKEDLLREMVKSPAMKGLLDDTDVAVSALMDRERIASTGIGGSVAVPHALLSGLDDIVLMLGLSNAGIDFNSGDGRKTNCVFLLLSPEGKQGKRLKLLSRISRLAKIDGFCESLLSLGSAGEIIEVIGETEKRFC